MDKVLWILQIFLAITFLYSGVMKTTQNRERLVRIGQTGVDRLAYPVIRMIGITEMLGSIGIVLPMAIHILPILTPVTATCFAMIMVLAAPIHYKRKELKSVVLNVILFLISVVVASFRFLQIQTVTQ